MFAWHTMENWMRLWTAYGFRKFLIFRLRPFLFISSSVFFALPFCSPVQLSSPAPSQSFVFCQRRKAYISNDVKCFSCIHTIWFSHINRRAKIAKEFLVCTHSAGKLRLSSYMQYTLNIECAFIFVSFSTSPSQSLYFPFVFAFPAFHLKFNFW